MSAAAPLGSAPPFGQLLTPALELRLHADAVLHAVKARAMRGILKSIKGGTTVYGWTRQDAKTAIRRHERRVQVVAHRIDAYLRATAQQQPGA